MRRIYQRSKHRRQGRPFLSHIVGVVVILGLLFVLVEFFSVVALDQKSYQEFWCGRDAIDTPLIYVAALACLLVLSLLTIEGCARLVGQEAQERGFHICYGAAASMLTWLLIMFAVQWSSIGSLNRCERVVGTVEYRSLSVAHRHHLQTIVCTSAILTKRDDYCGGFDPAANPVCDQWPDSYECERELVRRAWLARKE